MINTAKKLFILRYKKSGAIVKDTSGKPMVFDDKQAAKASRTEDMKVSFGPDHKNFNAHWEIV